MKTCNTSFLLKNSLLFCNESDRGNRVEPSAHYFWAEGSDKRPSAQYLRPNIQPIYQEIPQKHESKPVSKTDPPKPTKIDKNGQNHSTSRSTSPTNKAQSNPKIAQR